LGSSLSDRCGRSDVSVVCFSTNQRKNRTPILQRSHFTLQSRY
jgi:hypothetical protein